MDNVNMSNLICEQDIEKQFRQFDVMVEDKESLTKLKNICLINDYSIEKLVSEWLGFCNKKDWSNKVDSKKIELFEDECFRQAKLKFEIEDESKNETKFETDNAMQYQMNVDILSDYVMITDEEVKEMGMLNDQKNGIVKKENVQIDQQASVSNLNSKNDNQKIDQQNVEQQVKTADQSATNENTTTNCASENRLSENIQFGDHQVQSHLGVLMSPQEWINAERTIFKIEPLNHELHITKAYKTAQIKAHEANEILNEFIDEMYELLLSKLNEEPGILLDTLFVGRVNIEEDADTKSKVLLLENPRLFQRKLKIDLSKVESYSIFPGKIVCFEGEFQTEKNNLIVKKFFDDELFFPPFNCTPINLNNKQINIMTASGPIVPSMSDDLNNLEHLLKQVQIFQPHYLILLGPFFDCRNDYLLFNCEGESFFNKIMRIISSALDNIITKAIVIPSTFDLNNYNIFPAPPFEHSYPNIQFMPNPSFLNLNGIIISISSVDVFRHLLREEIRNVNNNNQDRICENILAQKSLYPLYPPNPEVNLEYSKLDFIKFNVRPHIFILPSMIKNYVKNIHGSIFINPEYISKGVFTKIRIESVPENHVGSIVNYTKIETVKNKTK